EKLGIQTPLYHRAAAWSSDGQWLAYIVGVDDRGGGIWVMPRQGQPRPFLNTRFKEIFPDFSPDSHWLAYASDESGRWEIYVRRFPEGGPAMQVSTGGGYTPVWSHDGGEIVYSGTKQEFFSVKVNPKGDGLEFTKPEKLFQFSHAEATPV